MTSRGIRKRFFIVGVPRSGTTLVQSLLTAHSSTTSFTESHFFDLHFTRLPLLSTTILTKNPAPRVRSFLTENGERPGDAASWFMNEGHGSLRMRPLLPLLTRPVSRRLLGVLDELALDRGAEIWVEKTPRHLRYIPFLERMSGAGGHPHFIHVIREGLEVVASLLEASQNWERPYDLETCVARWNGDVAWSLSRIAEPHDHFVLYEELASRPEATLRRLFAELGLGWESEILERYGTAADRLITGQETWKKDIGRDIRPSQTSGRTLTAGQRDRIKRTLRHNLYQELADGVARRLREASGPR